MAGFLTAKRTVGFKIEGTPYTRETLAVTDFNLSAYNITYDNDIAMRGRDLARGSFSRDPSIAGKRSATIGFSVDMAWSGTNATAPSYFGPLRACGMKQITWGSTGVSLLTDADYSNVPATIEVVEKDEGVSPAQLVFQFRGCMGNAKLVVDNVGEPMRIDFEFKGVLDGVVDRAYASLLTPTGFNTPNPDAMLGITTTVYSEAMKFNKIAIDLGNMTEVWTDPSKAAGLEGARIVDRNPSFDIDPDMTLRANGDHWARQINGTTGSFAMNVGNKISLNAPAAQIISGNKPGEREGHVVNNIKFELKRGSVDNVDFEIVHGTKA